MTTESKVREAPTETLRRALQIFRWTENVTFLLTFLFLVLGIWLDWRFLPTMIVPVLLWALSHMCEDRIAAELGRRR